MLLYEGIERVGVLRFFLRYEATQNVGKKAMLI
jgi:hypothetical protein